MSDKFMKIKELLEKKTGRKAVIKKMVKNNGTSYTGIFVEFESTNTLPVINLDAFYDECNAQKLSIDEITDKIIAVLNENCCRDCTGNGLYRDEDRRRPSERHLGRKFHPIS